ncbi:hypothetical protein L1987_17543 [Smallanthus sonchifolius]|uniref:Uncharacterized protein n=1 Tax=Smallanthus sonchifolius TaxID=185202 RepID=A0ACB9IZ99_9ASTR|nr:hypothetical protein L1987_17543 [Smallanthus sonchifolius]
MSSNNDLPELHTGDGEHDPDSRFHPQQVAAIQPSPENNADRSPNRNQPIRSNDSPKDSANVDSERKEPKIIGIRKNEGRRTVTMRELLIDLKNGYSNGNSPSSVVSTPPSSQESKQHKEQSNVVMALINSITSSDEERSRQRMLKFAAKRYASAIERNPDDYDALYNWALVLQECADNASSDTNSHTKDALLEEACKKYDEATELNPGLQDAYYNWAIAISDRAKLHGRTKEAEALWKQASKNYEKAVQLNWNSPQALNNWGLALQELGAIIPAREKQTIVKSAISKFRAAIQLQFDFHRAIYNLGTVLYGLAEDTSRTGVVVIGNEISSNELYSQSAIYVAAAHALKPNYSVYTSALKLVRSMLPLPYLKVGYLMVPPVENPVAPHCDWKRFQFVLNHEALQQIHDDEGKTNDRPGTRVDIPDIISVRVCSDLTLPPGPPICIDTIHGPIFLIADSWEYLDSWIDALRLVYTIFARGKTNVLAAIITG